MGEPLLYDVLAARLAATDQANNPEEGSIMDRRTLLAAGVAAPAALAMPSLAATPLPVLTGPVRIMIGGHSIAAGVGSGGGDGDRWALGSWLTGVAGLSMTFVGSQVSGSHPPWTHHEGYGNKTVAGYAAAIGGFLAANPAEILILRLGVNDAKAPLYRTAQQIANDYVTVINNARTQIPTIRILASEEIPPNGSVSAEYAAASTTVREFNALLPSITAPYGDAVHIGRNSMITTAMLGDGLHPNDNGYFTIAWIEMHQPDGIWPWLSSRPAPMTDAGPLTLDPFGVGRL